MRTQTQPQSPILTQTAGPYALNVPQTHLTRTWRQWHRLSYIKPSLYLGPQRAGGLGGAPQQQPEQRREAGQAAGQERDEEAADRDAQRRLRPAAQLEGTWNGASS